MRGLQDPINQSINRSINQAINQSSNQSINQAIDQSINQAINQSINQSSARSINQSIKRSIGGALDGLKKAINFDSYTVKFLSWGTNEGLHTFLSSPCVDTCTLTGWSRWSLRCCTSCSAGRSISARSLRESVWCCRGWICAVARNVQTPSFSSIVRAVNEEKNLQKKSREEEDKLLPGLVWNFRSRGLLLLQGPLSGPTLIDDENGMRTDVFGIHEVGIGLQLPPAPVHRAEKAQENSRWLCPIGNHDKTSRTASSTSRLLRGNLEHRTKLHNWMTRKTEKGPAYRLIFQKFNRSKRQRRMKDFRIPENPRDVLPVHSGQFLPFIRGNRMKSTINRIHRGQIRKMWQRAQKNEIPCSLL